MSHQTRIDQFYKRVGNKYPSHVIKKHSRLKTAPYSRSKEKDINRKQNVSLSQYMKSDDVSDCTIIHEKSNEMHDSFLNDTKIQYDDEIMKNNISLYENNHLEKTSTYINMQLQETLENKLNNDYMKTLELNSNNNSQLKKTPIKESNFANTKQRTPNKNNFSSQNTNSSSIHKKLSYTPRISFENKSPKIIEKKNLFDENINNSIIIQTIENMNLVKQGAISLHNFDLEKIYSKNTFDYQYNNINTENLMKYELNNINLCNDLNSKILFTTIFSVLSLPINCGYFDENDLDFIYSIITLPINAQMLLARMIKRKRKWFRKNNISYPEINTELKDIFEILVSRSICTFDIQKENLSTILELLQVNEIQQLCKNMKINPKGNKKSNIQKLLKLSNNKPLFPGVKSPSNFLYASILDILDYCVCITIKTWNIIDRIITLLIPNQNPRDNTSDIFYFLCDVYLGKTIFPNNSGDYFPVFSCKLHLINYMEAKSILSTTLQYIEKKDWKKVQEYGNLAMDILPNLLEIESLKLKNSILPMHVRYYMPGYIWLKILSKCIEAFKKNRDKKRVVEILSFLLKQNCHMLSHKGKWYEELALIEMYHHKNIEISASIIIQALNTENLTQVDKVNLIDRANKIVKKKIIKSITKTTVNKILDDYISYMPKYKPTSIIINATVMPRNTAGNKSIWCIKSSIENQTYGSVETVAFHHYQKQGFPNGLHCEGALPNILFCTLFWEELYDIHIPGAFVTPYQEAPGDLYTDQFYKNRKEKIDMKLKIISDLNSELLSSKMKEKFIIFKQYQSVMLRNLDNNLQLEEIVHCLGVQGVVGICKRLIENFKLWRAGFPDLIVWNYDTKKHKIIEVKGPRDVLSTKQRLWLEYLHQLGLNIEVCLVQDKC